MAEAVCRADNTAAVLSPRSKPKAWHSASGMRLSQTVPLSMQGEMAWPITFSPVSQKNLWEGT